MKRVAFAAVVLALPAAVSGQQMGYRLRLDSRAQAVSYRGLALDSIPRSDTIAGSRGPQTSDGFLVTCFGTSLYCTFFRPGPIEHAAPLTTGADLTLWGLGVRGLSVALNARGTGDFVNADAWPGDVPGFQLLEGYAQYERDVASLGGAGFVGQLGRQTFETRFGFTGFDGARVTVRNAASTLEASGYGGWGLARAIALPVTSPALNPLDEFRPSRRQLVAGGSAGWRSAFFNVRANYEREVEQETRFFVSEQAGADFVVGPLAGWSVTGGADYDIAAALWGSAEATVWVPPFGPIEATLGVSRYRPHFDLWTIWGAFSPVPYRSVQGTLWFASIANVRFRVRGQRYAFENADVSTPLVSYETSGWRYSWGATYATTAWTVDAGYHAEFGPGASSRGIEGAVTMSPRAWLLLSLYAATLDRPLEFRLDDTSLRTYGMNATYRATPRVELRLDAAGYHQRDRPDFASVDWNQLRMSAGITLLFGSNADVAGLPPAVQRMPGGRSARDR